MFKIEKQLLYQMSYNLKDAKLDIFDDFTFFRTLRLAIN